MKFSFIHIYQFLLNVSIDVVAGAVCMALFVGRALEVKIPVITLILLGAAVWSIYTLDHLLDARKVRGDAVSIRHLFHFTHFKVLSFFVGMVVSVSGIIAVLFLPLTVWKWGSFALLVAVSHLLLTHLQCKDQFRFILKEFGVALNYSLGVFIGAISCYHFENSYAVPLCYFCLLLGLTSINLLMYSYLDFEQDVNNRMYSITFILGLRKVKVLILVLVGVELFLGSVFLYQGLDVRYILFCMGAAVFYCLLILMNNSLIRGSYKLFADLIFILPLCLV